MRTTAAAPARRLKERQRYHHNCAPQVLELQFKECIKKVHADKALRHDHARMNAFFAAYKASRRARGTLPSLARTCSVQTGTLPSPPPRPPPSSTFMGDSIGPCAAHYAVDLCSRVNCVPEHVTAQQRS